MTTGSAFELGEATALIFGGSAGIGLACAKAYAAAGIPRIMLAARNEARGNDAARTIRKTCPNCEVVFISADATCPEGAQAAVGACVGVFGDIDILLSTAGASAMPAIFHTIDSEDLAPAINGPLYGAIYPAHAALPHMMARGRGVILTVASDAAKVATPGEVAIGAAMAGIVMFSKGLAIEAKRSGIRVNCLTPSIVRNTPLYDQLMADPFAGKLFDKAEKLAALGVVEPDDLAQMAVYLASPAAARLTGQAISINGGISAG
jgi:gluconate 5-dehydrogenase/3-oxoacyl-[acyl-carrier protein] reductase